MASETCERDLKEPYIYGTLGILGISLLSLVGALVLPCLRRGSQDRWMQIFVALAVSTLVGDAFLHLIPETLGLHSHAEAGRNLSCRLTSPAADPLSGGHLGEEGRFDLHRHGAKRQEDHDGHDHAGEEGEGHEEHDHEAEKGPMIKMAVVFAAMYVFFLFESVASGIAKAKKEKKIAAKASAASLSLKQLDHGAARVSSPHHGRVAPVLDRAPSLHMPDGSYAPQPAYQYAWSGYEVPYGYYTSSTQYAAPFDHQYALAYEANRHNGWHQDPNAYYAEPNAHHHHQHRHHKSRNQPHHPRSRSAEGRKSVTSAAQVVVVEAPDDGGHGHSHDVGEDQPELCCGFKAVAWMILVGDAVHNIADGIAVGASFVSGNSAGFSTLIAVACHELPHEIGDFAVLLDSGLSVWKALFLNFLSALSAFGGLYAGIHLGNDDQIRPWLFALTAGMFLYVGLVDMLSHLKGMGKKEPWWINAIMQNIGLLLGFAIIFLLGWFEDRIKI